MLFILVSSSFSSRECTDEDYFYWPQIDDSIYIHLNEVTAFFKKEDSLLGEIKEIERKTETIGHWRAYYKIHKRYEKLEELSKGKHSKKEEYYKRLKIIYLNFSIQLRRFSFLKRVTKEYFKIE